MSIKPFCDPKTETAVTPHGVPYFLQEFSADDKMTNFSFLQKNAYGRQRKQSPRISHRDLPFGQQIIGVR